MPLTAARPRRTERFGPGPITPAPGRVPRVPRALRSPRRPRRYHFLALGAAPAQPLRPPRGTKGPPGHRGAPRDTQSPPRRRPRPARTTGLQVPERIARTPGSSVPHHVTGGHRPTPACRGGQVTGAVAARGRYCPPQPWCRRCRGPAGPGRSRDRRYRSLCLTSRGVRRERAAPAQLVTGWWPRCCSLRSVPVLAAWCCRLPVGLPAAPQPRLTLLGQ